MQVFPSNVMTWKNCRSKKPDPSVSAFIYKENNKTFFVTPGRVTEREMAETFQSRVDFRDGTFVESFGLLSVDY